MTFPSESNPDTLNSAWASGFNRCAAAVHVVQHNLTHEQECRARHQHNTTPRHSAKSNTHHTRNHVRRCLRDPDCFFTPPRVLLPWLLRRDPGREVEEDDEGRGLAEVPVTPATRLLRECGRCVDRREEDGRGGWCWCEGPRADNGAGATASPSLESSPSSPPWPSGMTSCMTR